MLTCREVHSVIHKLGLQHVLLVPNRPPARLVGFAHNLRINLNGTSVLKKRLTTTLNFHASVIFTPRNTSCLNKTYGCVIKVNRLLPTKIFICTATHSLLDTFQWFVRQKLVSERDCWQHFGSGRLNRISRWFSRKHGL